jgi:hypothetical protein
MRGVKRRYTTKPKGKRRAYNLGAMARDLNAVKRSLNTETKTIKLLTHTPVDASESGMSHDLYKEAILKSCVTVQNPLSYTFAAIPQGDASWNRHGNSIKYTHLTIKGKISIIGARTPAGTGTGVDEAGAAYGEQLTHCHGSKFTFMLVALKNGQAFNSPLTQSSVEKDDFGRYFHSFLDHEYLGSNDEADYPASFLKVRRSQQASNMKVLMRRTIYHAGNAEDDPGTGIKDKLFQFKVPLNVIQKYWRDLDTDPFNPSDPWVQEHDHRGNQEYDNQFVTTEPKDEQFELSVKQQTNNTTDIKANSLHLLVFSDHKPKDTNQLVKSGDNFINPLAGPLYRIAPVVSYLNYVDN